MEVKSIPLNQILLDEEFNCRNKIDPMTCMQLANGIKKDGLLQPIVVQPYSNPKHPDKSFRIIAGHRRYTAFKLNKEESIPCVIREDITDERSAFTANVQENLNRTDLNLMEQALIVGRYIAMGLNREEIAKEIDISTGWVQSRTQMFQLPVEVQREIVIHNIPISEVKFLHTTFRTKSIEQLYEHVKGIKDGKKNPLKAVKKPKKKDAKRIRSRTEMQDLINHIREEGAGACIVTRVLAWAAGNVTDGEIDLDLKEWHDLEGYAYTPLLDDGSDDYS